MKVRVLSIVVLMFARVVMADNDSKYVELSVFDEGDIAKQAQIDGGIIRLAEMKNGKLLVANMNGRYVIVNPTLVDTWSGKVVSSVDEFKSLRGRISKPDLIQRLRKMGFATLGTASATDGLLLIIDPTDSNQLSFLDMAYKTAKGTGTYLDLVFVATKGNHDSVFSRFCAVKGDVNMIDKILSGDVIDNKCEPDAQYLAGSMLPMLLGVENLPYVVNSRGVVFQNFNRANLKDMIYAE